MPDTGTELSKTDFINRQLAIHAVEPMSGESRDSDDNPVSYALDSAGVTSEMGTWYDTFVASKS